METENGFIGDPGSDGIKGVGEVIEGYGGLMEAPMKSRIP